MIDFKIVSWFAERLNVCSFETFARPDRFYWLFESLRVIAICFLILFLLQLLVPGRMGPAFRALSLHAFWFYVTVSITVEVVLCMGAFWLEVSSVTERQVWLCQRILLSWILELVFLWSLACIPIILRSAVAGWQRDGGSQGRTPEENGAAE
jgi:hypothetical protein